MFVISLGLNINLVMIFKHLYLYHFLIFRYEDVVMMVEELDDVVDEKGRQRFIFQRSLTKRHSYF